MALLGSFLPEHLQWVSDPSLTIDNVKSYPADDGHLSGCAHGLLERILKRDASQLDSQTPCSTTLASDNSDDTI